MIQNTKSFFRRTDKNESGQVIVWLAFMLLVLMGMIGFVVDIGRLYYSYRLLQNSTDAAALAGAQAMPDTASAVTAQVTLYSSVSGNKNAYWNLPGVTMVSGYPKLLCLSSIGLPCLNSSGAIVGSGGANALQVAQTVTVPMTLAALVGIKPIPIVATATAAMKGAARAPYNVAIVVDTTPSMRNTDTDGLGCTGTKIQCALQGVQTLLGELSPCGASLSSCGSVSAGNVTNPIDQVSLLTFPAVSTATAADDYCNPSGTVAVQPYPLPVGPPYTTLTGSPTPTYQIVGFSSDYRTSDSSSSLNSSSNLAKGAGLTATGCSGLQAKRSNDSTAKNTYYAATIYNAASMLLSQQASRGSSHGVPLTDNALIVLGDGDSTAQHPNAFGVNDLASTASTTSTTYPSYVDQCQQAVTAARWATSQGVTVYSVAYDSQGSGTCLKDTSNSPPVNKSGITACQTMEMLATTPSRFYTSNSSCTLTGGNTVMSLNAIFTAIAGDMSLARLVPNTAQ